MEKHHTHPSSKRLLLNAEAFGFGPATAMAALFPYLRKTFSHIGYIGQGHTLDHHAQLPYDAIYDSDTLHEEEIKAIAQTYDLFFTAMDFSLAQIMKQYGLTTCVYDALARYWPDLEKLLTSVDLYLAQNFFGVQERLEHIENKTTQKAIVSPIVSPQEENKKREYILINLGGLHNPFWSTDDVICYAEKMLKAIHHVIPTHEKIVIATSYSIAQRLPQYDIKTFSKEEMRTIMSEAKLAFMTPGLGNMYDAACHDLPTIWLPPANDSQGQQLSLVIEKGIYDGQLDRSLIRNHEKIDYKDAQTVVINQISTAVHTVSDEQCTIACQQQYDIVKDKTHSEMKKLIELFGTNGEEQAANILYEYALNSSFTPNR